MLENSVKTLPGRREISIRSQKISNFLARDVRASCRDVCGREQVYVGRQNNAKKDLYIKEALAPTVMQREGLSVATSPREWNMLHF